MCLIALASGRHPAYPLVLIANRDELHARPAAPAGPDPEHPDVHGGRDLLQGGSCELVRGFAVGDSDTDAWLDALAPVASEHGPFNLLLWDGSALAFASNHPRFERQPVAPGLHAVSNGAFDAPWPKSNLSSRALSAWLERGPLADAREADVSPLLDALADRTPAPDAALPDTGIGLDLERRLSPPFVRDPTYGTRCSTVVLVQHGGIRFVERRFGPDAEVLGESDAWLPRDP